MSNQSSTYGAARERGPSVSHAEIERAARALMAAGQRPTVKSVMDALGRGSPNHITSSMQRFWKDQAAMNQGDPLALSRLPPELADAAVALWEQALRLSLQTAKYEENAARSYLEKMRLETEQRIHSVELREREWDMSARVRERALADARDHIGVLMKELVNDRASLRARDVRIADLENQIEDYRNQLSKIVVRAVANNRLLKAKKPPVRRPTTPKPKRKAKRRPAIITKSSRKKQHRKS